MANENAVKMEQTPEDVARELLCRIGGYIPDYQRAIFKFLTEKAADSITGAELEERMDKANSRACDAVCQLNVEQTEALADFLENLSIGSGIPDLGKFLLLMRVGTADNDAAPGDPVRPGTAENTN